jgi:hypothetical protein
MKAKPNSKISNANRGQVSKGDKTGSYAEDPKKIYWAEKHSL